MTRIGIVHFRTGEMDGVSLEIEKYVVVLRKLGHEVYLCAGRSGSPQDVFIIPELDFDHPGVRFIRSHAFDRCGDFGNEKTVTDEKGLAQAIERLKGVIQEGFHRFLEEKRIDLLAVHNLCSLPLNLPATLALLDVVRDRRIPVLAHHHDFYWEKEGYRPAWALVRKLLRTCYPPTDPGIKHIVINSLAQARLQLLGLTASIIPNVFDFDRELRRDSFNARLPEILDLSPAHVVFLQATRVVPRKGIELAVDLVSLMSTKRFAPALQRYVRRRGGQGSARPILLLPNQVEDQTYCRALMERIARRGVDARFVSRWVGVCRDEKASKFSLWDAYVYADFVTYPSLQEGWGNQFLEAVWAKRPIAVFEYPVFRTDIAPLGFRYVSLGCEVQRGDDGLVHVPRPILQRAAAEVAHLFSHPKEYEKVVRHNFALGRAFFSLDVLAAALDKLIREMLNVG